MTKKGARIAWSLTGQPFLYNQGIRKKSYSCICIHELYVYTVRIHKYYAMIHTGCGPSNSKKTSDICDIQRISNGPTETTATSVSKKRPPGLCEFGHVKAKLFSEDLQIALQAKTWCLDIFGRENGAMKNERDLDGRRKRFNPQVGKVQTSPRQAIFSESKSRNEKQKIKEPLQDISKRMQKIA